MLKEEEIYVGKPLIYRWSKLSWFATVIEIDEEGFVLGFHDGDRTYIWYEYDMGMVMSLETK
jgi:hypothetical protein